jgi:hypothetical protein
VDRISLRTWERLAISIAPPVPSKRRALVRSAQQAMILQTHGHQANVGRSDGKASSRIGVRDPNQVGRCHESSRPFCFTCGAPASKPSRARDCPRIHKAPIGQLIDRALGWPTLERPDRAGAQRRWAEQSHSCPDILKMKAKHDVMDDTSITPARWHRCGDGSALPHRAGARDDLCRCKSHPPRRSSQTYDLRTRLALALVHRRRRDLSRARRASCDTSVMNLHLPVRPIC